MKRKILKENLLKSVIRKVLLEDKTWEEIAKSGSETAKSLADLMDKYYEEEKNKNTIKSTKLSSSTEPPSKTQSSSTKSSYDKNKDELNKDLPEFTVTGKKTKNKYDALLIGGLDYRRGDYTIGQQVNLLKSSFGQNKNIKGVRFNTSADEIKKILDENPGIYVFMFSKGCEMATNVANNKNVNKDKVFIIEPYATSKNTANIVKSAVTIGVPKKNVFVGPESARGLGVVGGASTTQKGLSHWQALSDIGNRI